VSHAMEKIDQQVRREAEAKRNAEEHIREKEAEVFLTQLQQSQAAGITLSVADSEDLAALTDLRKSKRQIKEQIAALEQRKAEFDQLLARIRDIPRPSDVRSSFQTRIVSLITRFVRTG